MPLRGFSTSSTLYTFSVAIHSTKFLLETKTSLKVFPKPSLTLQITPDLVVLRTVRQYLLLLSAVKENSFIGFCVLWLICGHTSLTHLGFRIFIFRLRGEIGMLLDWVWVWWWIGQADHPATFQHQSILLTTEQILIQSNKSKNIKFIISITLNYSITFTFLKVGWIGNCQLTIRKRKGALIEHPSYRVEIHTKPLGVQQHPVAW